MATTMTVKGQVLMPKAIRDKAGIKPGMRLEWSIDEQGRPLLTKASDETEDERRRRFRAAVEKARGSMKNVDAFQGMSTDDFMALVREPLP